VWRGRASKDSMSCICLDLVLGSILELLLELVLGVINQELVLGVSMTAVLETETELSLLAFISSPEYFRKYKFSPNQSPPPVQLTLANVLMMVLVFGEMILMLSFCMIAAIGSEDD